MYSVSLFNKLAYVLFNVTIIYSIPYWELFWHLSCYLEFLYTDSLICFITLLHHLIYKVQSITFQNKLIISYILIHVLYILFLRFIYLYYCMFLLKQQTLFILIPYFVCIVKYNISLTIYFYNIQKQFKETFEIYSNYNHPDEICSICLDSLVTNVSMIKECKHCFHKDCIERWFTQQKSCPYCRTYI